ncbi:MAG: thymidylate synthase [Patescibacteria group bacterium]|nr:thymidylate synthase [Patescibacteria group bacterium]
MRHPEYQYLDLLKEILETGDRKVDQGTGDASFSVFGKQMRFDLSKGFPLLTTKKVYWKGVVEELYWFISGQSNVTYLTKKGVHIWDDYPFKIYNEAVRAGKEPQISKEDFINKMVSDEEFGKKWGELKRIYGEMWRRWPTKTPGRTVDQLKWVIDELTQDPNAHNAIVNSWNPEYLYTMATREEACRFPICHNMYQVNIIKNKVCLQLYQRSADLFLGVPFNIASYALLTHIIAKVLGREVGDFVHTFGDVHIYENHLEQVKEQLKREPKPFPTISIDDSVKTIDDFKPEHVKLENYEFHPALKAELSVSGGVF